MTSIDNVVAQVTSNMGSLTNNCHKDAANKVDFAQKCGLTSLTERGSFAALVATHDQLPDIVIKVVPNYDKYIDFAQDMLDGLLDNPMFPVVYSVTRMDTHTVVLVERITGDADSGTDLDRIDHLDGDMSLLDDSIEWDFLDMLHHCCARHDALPDLHAGNFMKRADGTLVCIDPIFANARG